jgi:short-subunit dehydrogenase
MTGRLALITGASSGIGAAFARLYASHGYDLWLTARRKDRLDDLATDIRMSSGVEVNVTAADLADPKTPDALLSEIALHGASVSALVNNAGYGLPGPFAASTWEQHQAFLQVMLTAPIEFCHKVLPAMIEARFGRIVNVASLAGLVPRGPDATLYGGSKAMLIRFSQCLHLEVADAGVHVSALCPGFTYSEFHDANHTRAQITQSVPSWLWMGADEVAAAGYEAAEANRALSVPGAPNKAIAALGKLAPDEWLLALMSSQAGRGRKL